MKKNSLRVLKIKIEDRVLLEGVIDNILKLFRYRDTKLAKLYKVVVAKKRRMVYYKRIKHRFLKEAVDVREWENAEQRENANKVWMCWLQGIDNAPDIVKCCVASVKEQLKDKEITILDEKTLFDYVDLPDYIIEKWRKGIISHASFMDLVRMELLLKYGGYWIDATVFMTDTKVLEYIEKVPLFMFNWYYFGFSGDIMQLNNWFIYSRTNNPIIALTLKISYLYWAKMDRVYDYFLTQLIMTVVCEYYKEEYDAIPLIGQVNAHVLADYMFEKFDENVWSIIKEGSGIHKLSHKFDSDLLEENDTFYDVLIKRRNMNE